MKHLSLLLFISLILFSAGCGYSQEAGLNNKAKDDDSSTTVIALTFHLGFNTSHEFIGSDLRTIYQSSRFDKGLSSSIDRNGMRDLLLSKHAVKKLYEIVTDKCDTIRPNTRHKAPLIEVTLFSFDNSDFRTCYYYEDADAYKLFTDMKASQEGEENSIETQKRFQYYADLFKNK